jgi:hypothetical protein
MLKQYSEVIRKMSDCASINSMADYRIIGHFRLTMNIELFFIMARVKNMYFLI